MWYIDGLAFQILRVYAISGGMWLPTIPVVVLQVVCLVIESVRSLLYCRMLSAQLTFACDGQYVWANSIFPSSSPLDGCALYFASTDLLNKYVVTYSQLGLLLRLITMQLCALPVRF